MARENKNKIPVSVGVLTYNSGKVLERCLSSVTDFAEVVVADGGSTDNTLEIARKYGCRVMPQSVSGPIQDISFEQNRMVEASSHDWYFCLDSDEVMTLELRDTIAKIVLEANPPYLLYRVRFAKVPPDLSHEYKTFKPQYQIRFFNKNSGARFTNPSHPHVVFDSSLPAGRMEAPWYVVMDDEDWDFRAYRAKVDRRIRRMLRGWRPNSTRHAVFKIIGVPLFEFTKSLFKLVYVPLRYGREAIPARYELFRIYSHYALAREYLRRILSS